MQNLRQVIQLALLFSLVAAWGCFAQKETDSPSGRHGNFAAETLQVNGEKRVFRLVVPETVDLSQPAPFVVAFHGMVIDSKDVMPVYTKLNETAKKHKFIIAYPNALDKSWGLVPKKVKKDLAFFDALTANITTRYKIDPDRIYVLGMSNGGYFAHLVGKTRSRKVAAVASHSGPLGLETLFIRAARKFPVLIIHGKNDNLLPVKWSRDNCKQYRKEGHKVKYVEVPDLGHFWATDADINETIWAFFENHPLK